jgi:peptidoglycan/xylan/chitin deacetylase (PgdA/CDA1 family)
VGDGASGRAGRATPTEDATAGQPGLRGGRASKARGGGRRKVPVLMYHRIATDGPDALARYRLAPEALREQLGWLRSNGFHGIDSRQLAAHLRSGQPLPGRPVLLTFDDGFADFAESAWPLLREHGFPAEVFVVTGLAGWASEWDRDSGGAFPLMDPATLVRLHGEGVRFGSHLVTHRPASGLSTRELAAELLQSRATLARWLGEAPTSLAAPHGDLDGRLRQLASECGYDLCFGTHPGLASVRGDPLHTPRQEVWGHWTLDDFAACLEEGL